MASKLASFGTEVQAQVGELSKNQVKANQQNPLPLKPER